MPMPIPAMRPCLPAGRRAMCLQWRQASRNLSTSICPMTIGASGQAIAKTPRTDCRDPRRVSSGDASSTSNALRPVHRPSGHIGKPLQQQYAVALQDVSIGDTPPEHCSTLVVYGKSVVVRQPLPSAIHPDPLQSASNPLRVSTGDTNKKGPQSGPL
jgi:hypothetical protein